MASSDNSVVRKQVLVFTKQGGEYALTGHGDFTPEECLMAIEMFKDKLVPKSKEIGRVGDLSDLVRERRMVLNPSRDG